MGAPEDQERAVDRANGSFLAIRRPRLYSKRRRLFGRRRWLFRRTYENLWPFASAWSAVCTLSALADGHAASGALPLFIDGLAAYHRSHGAVFSESGPLGYESCVVPPLGTGGALYFDDNAWLALALMRHHEINGDLRALALAQRLFEFVLTGWSNEQSWSHPGGIRWKQPTSNTSRNACSNAPVAQLGALVHLRTGDEDALIWAIRIYEWVREVLLSPDGLYFDQVDPVGRLNTDVWSYNQGTMIGAGVLLHRITGEQNYLRQASVTAAASMTRFPAEALAGRDAAFHAVFFRNLFMLDQVMPDSSYRQLALTYGNGMWEQFRDPSTGLFNGNMSQLNNSAPLVEIYALLAGAPLHP